MKLKDGVEVKFSSDIWYDILDGGYFNPEDFLDSDDDIKQVQEAIDTLLEYASLVHEED